MKKRPERATQHAQVRRAHATETADDYVEAIATICQEKEICRAVDLAKQFGVSHVTVNRTLGRLKLQGLVSAEPYGPVQLTVQGQKIARQAQERHDIVYRFLLALGVREPHASIDAEGIEHHVSPETLRLMREFCQARKPDSA